MSIENFLCDFSEAIEIEPNLLCSQTEFKKLEVWDSMNALNIIAMVDVKYEKTIGGNEIEKSVTLSDLWKTISE